jgi:glutamine amidotransferase PdxT
MCARRNPFVNQVSSFLEKNYDKDQYIAADCRNPFVNQVSSFKITAPKPENPRGGSCRNPFVNQVSSFGKSMSINQQIGE